VARQETYCPPMTGAPLDARTAPVADRYCIDIKWSPWRWSTVTAQGRALQLVVYVTPLGSVVTTCIAAAPGTPGRFASTYNASAALGCTPPTRNPGHEDCALKPKKYPNHLSGGGDPEIMYCPSSIGSM
jgi:hypothetical protein